MIPEPPIASRIGLIESSISRVVMVIPPGGKRARSMGCFALMWNGITGTVTGGFAFAYFTGADWDGDPPPGWMLFLFMSIFWAVGLGMLYAWVRMRFTRYLIAVEPDQLSIQRQLFGRKKNKITKLDENSRAELKVSYTENDDPVYAVRVQGVDDEESFGTALDRASKDWIVMAINSVIQPDSATTPMAADDFNYCPECGVQLMDSARGKFCPDCERVFSIDELNAFAEDSDQPSHESVSPIAPSSLPDESEITVEVEEPDRLVLSYAAIRNPGAKVILGGFFGVFGLGWTGFAGSMLLESINPFDLISFIVSVLFTGAGVVPLGVALLLFFGRVRILVDEQKVEGRIGLGPIRYARSLPTADIRAVGLDVDRSGEFQGDSRTNMMSSGRTAVVRTEEDEMYLSFGTVLSLDRQVCGLVRYQLERLGKRF